MLLSFRHRQNTYRAEAQYRPGYGGIEDVVPKADHFCFLLLDWWLCKEFKCDLRDCQIESKTIENAGNSHSGSL